MINLRVALPMNQPHSLTPDAHKIDDIFQKRNIFKQKTFSKKTLKIYIFWKSDFFEKSDFLGKSDFLEFFDFWKIPSIFLISR